MPNSCCFRDRHKRPLGCDTFVAYPPTTAKGCVISGKNSDRPSGEGQPLRKYSRRSYPEGSRLNCTSRKTMCGFRFVQLILASMIAMGRCFVIQQHVIQTTGSVALSERMPLQRKTSLGSNRVLITPPPSTGDGDSSKNKNKKGITSGYRSRATTPTATHPNREQNRDSQGPDWVFLYPEACTCMLQNSTTKTTVGASIQSAGVFDIPPDSCQGGYYGNSMLDPESVLESGLESRGDNWDLLNHVLQKGNSAYRGTTKQIVYPEDGVGAAAFAGEDGYVYEITCVPSWDVNKHLQGRIKSSQWATKYGGNLANGEHEFAIPSFVPPSHIKRYGKVVQSAASGTLFVPRTAWVQNPGWNPAFCKYSVSDYSCEVIKVLLEELDLDGNKTLDLDEFRNAVETNPLLREASSEFPAMDIQTVFEQFDTDGSGTISSEELRNFLMQKEASCGRLPCS